MEHFYCRDLFFSAPFQSIFVGGSNECAEQRMRLQWLRLELGMKLATNKVWMVREFHHFYISPVGCRTRNSQSRRDHRLFIFAVEFVTMTVTLADLKLSINRVCERVRFNLARPRSQP